MGFWAWMLLAIGLWGGSPGAALRATPTLDEARSLHGAGRLDEALAAYRELMGAGDAVEPAARATAYNNACVILMNRGDFSAALEACGEALHLRRDIGDSRRSARTLNNLGLVLQYVGSLEESESRFQEALDINRADDDVEAQIINLANLGVLAVTAGEYGRALALHGTAAELAAAHSGEPWSRRQAAIAELNRAGVLEVVGSYREALAAYQRVAENLDVLGPRGVATLQMNLGVVYRNLGDPLLAIQAYETALAAFEGLGDSPGVANAWLNIGLAQHLNLGDLEAAEAALVEALALARRNEDRRGEIRGLISLGQLYLDQGRLEMAADSFNTCLEVAAASDSTAGRWAALAGLAHIAAVRGESLVARDLFRQAIDEVEAGRVELEGVDIRADFLAARRSVFADFIRLLSALHDKHPEGGFAAEALGVAQLAKARDLQDVLGAAEWGAAGGGEGAAAAAHELVLEYFVGEERLYLWKVGRQGVDLFDLGPQRPILGAVGELYRTLSSGGRPDAERIADLSVWLLGPVVADLAKAETLSIAADGRLLSLSFEMLADPAADPAAGGVPLVERVAVRYLPVSGLERSVGREELADRPAHLLMGNPTLDSGGGVSGTVGEMVRRLRLEPLPAAEEEIASIERWLPGDGLVALGSAATEAAFRRAAGDGARVVHLATHAVAESSSGLGAAILLAPSASEDGLLEPREIASLDCPATLTVLSSCRTALGPVDRASSLSTLTGAFLASGSEAVVATLWEVGDQTTAAFMDQFYFHLGQGLRPIEALQRAKQAFRAEPKWNPPHLWAAYVLIGDAPSLVKSSGSWRWAWTAAGVGALLLAALYLIRRRS